MWSTFGTITPPRIWQKIRTSLRTRHFRLTASVLAPSSLYPLASKYGNFRLWTISSVSHSTAKCACSSSLPLLEHSASALKKRWILSINGNSTIDSTPSQPSCRRHSSAKQCSWRNPSSLNQLQRNVLSSTQIQRNYMSRCTDYHHKGCQIQMMTQTLLQSGTIGEQTSNCKVYGCSRDYLFTIAILQQAFRISI